MSLTTYPLNNIDYTAEDAELFHCTRTSGIWANDSFSLSLTGADNNITIGKGLAWIKNDEFAGKVTAMKSPEVVDMGIADSAYPRIDVIALQFNANNNATQIVVKKGTPATNPIRPAIVRTAAVYELYLASVYRPAAATAIMAGNVTDLRMDDTVCGLMADSVTKVDMELIRKQIEELIQDLKAEIEAIEDTSGLMLVSEWAPDGYIPVEKGGTGAATIDDLRELLGGVEINLLWENASPTSSFSLQSIAIDGLDDYDFFILFSHTDKENDRVVTTIVLPRKLTSIQYIVNINSSSYRPLFVNRAFRVHPDRISFDPCYSKNDTDSLSTTNSRLIPYQLLGIKGVR